VQTRRCASALPLGSQVVQVRIVKLYKDYTEEANMSDRVSWIEYKGARILYADYSGLSGEEFIEVI